MLDGEEMERRAAIRDAALTAYQAKLREFDQFDRPLTVRSGSIGEKKARGRRQTAFLADAKAALDAAREHYRDGLCAEPDV